MSVVFTFNNVVVDKTKNISLIENGYSEDIQNIFGFSLQASLESTSIGTLGNYFPDSSDAQAILTDLPSPTFRTPGGTDSWATSRNASYNGGGSRYFVDNNIMPFESNVVGNVIYDNSIEKDKVDKSIDDELQPHNFFLKFEAGIASINDSGSHSYVINYHTDWNGSSYDTTEIDAALAIGIYDYVEIGNELNATGYELTFPTADETSEGGHGWDVATQDYIQQNRDFYRDRTTYLETQKGTYSNLKILMTAPPPQFLLYQKFNVPQTSWSKTIIRQKDFVEKLVADLTTGATVIDGWIHHIYNQVGDFLSTSTQGTPPGVRDPSQTMVENALAFVSKVDVSGQLIGDYPYHGLKGNYVEYILRNYITPYEEAYPGLDHTVTEWAFSNGGTGTVDTMLAAANVMKYLLAFNRINEVIDGKITLATYQKFLSKPPEQRVANDRAYALSVMFPAQATNFWKTAAIYTATDFQPSVELQVFKLFKSVEGGTFIGTTKHLGDNTSLVMDEDVAIELFEDSSNNQWLYYVNVTDEDITINMSGTNTYVQGDGAAGFSANSIADEWVSGTYAYDGISAEVTNYPMISINSVGSDNTLRARTVGRIEL